jgi:hypothetical protein
MLREAWLLTVREKWSRQAIRHFCRWKPFTRMTEIFAAAHMNVSFKLSYVGR